VARFIAKLRDLIGHKWKDLAHQLGFEQTEIDAIEHNNIFNLKEQIFQFFHKWQQQKGQDASVEMLVEGLKAAKLQTQLDALEKAGLLPKGQFTQYTDFLEVFIKKMTISLHCTADKLRSPADSAAELELVRKKRLEILSGSKKLDASQEFPSRVETSQAVGITSPTATGNDDSTKRELNLANDPSDVASARVDRPFEVEDVVKVPVGKGGAWIGVIRWIGGIDELCDGSVAGLETVC